MLREIAPTGICPVMAVESGEIENLPEASEGTWLIVSAMVANAGRAQGRHDLLVPARIVRATADGDPVGCLALASE